MELPSTATCFVFFSSIFFIFVAAMKKKKRVVNGKLPPGPRPLPVIGSIHHLLFKPPHHALYELAKKHGHLMHLRMGETSLVVASSPEAAREILKTQEPAFLDRPRMFALRELGPDLSFGPYDDRWRKIIEVCHLGLLSPTRVASFAPIREEETSRFVSSVNASSPGTVDLTRMLKDLTDSISARTIVGQRKHKEVALLLARETVNTITGLTIVDLFPSSATLRWLCSCFPSSNVSWDKKIKRIIHDRRDRGRSKHEGEDEDLLDVLLRLQDEGELPVDSLNGVLLGMLAGTSDTSSAMLEWAMSELVRNPGVMERVQSEIRREIGGGGQQRLTHAYLQGRLRYVRMVMKETFRLHPGGPFIPRRSVYPCRVLGYDVPEKANVLINLWAIGRDPRYWDNPHEFRPERFMDSDKDYKGNHFDLLSFGTGLRICPGMGFATANIEFILANLLYHFDWKLPAGVGPGDLDMSEILTVAARRKVNLFLCPVPVF